MLLSRCTQDGAPWWLSLCFVRLSPCHPPAAATVSSTVASSTPTSCKNVPSVALFGGLGEGYSLTHSFRKARSTSRWARTLPLMRSTSG
eukprot:2903940-Prymnesium_polylepis.2